MYVSVPTSECSAYVCTYVVRVVCVPSPSNLPKVDTITIKLYKESQTKKKKDKSSVAELGTIDLPVHQLSGGGEMEKW